MGWGKVEGFERGYSPPLSPSLPTSLRACVLIELTAGLAFSRTVLGSREREREGERERERERERG